MLLLRWHSRGTDGSKVTLISQAPGLMREICRCELCWGVKSRSYSWTPVCVRCFSMGRCKPNHQLNLSAVFWERKAASVVYIMYVCVGLIVCLSLCWGYQGYRELISPSKQVIFVNNRVKMFMLKKCPLGLFQPACFKCCFSWFWFRVLPFFVSCFKTQTFIRGESWHEQETFRRLVDFFTFLPENKTFDSFFFKHKLTFFAQIWSQVLIYWYTK